MFSGKTPAHTLSIPTALATVDAVFLLSPVSIYVSMPILCNSSIVLLELALILSDKLKIPLISLSTPIKIIVLLRSSSLPYSSKTLWGISISWDSKSFLFPAKISLSLTWAFKPLPVIFSNDEVWISSRFMSLAFLTIALAIGWLEFFSTLAASSTNSFSLIP